MNQNIAIGADIGGSHISCAAVDLSTARVLKNTFSDREVNNKGEAEEIISTWTECVKDVIGRMPSPDISGIGFAMPGPFDYVKGISYIKGNAKYEKLYGINIAEALGSKLGLPDKTMIRFMNDASSFAVGEAWVGKGAGYKRLMCITLGTGLGSAFIADKVPVVDGPDVPGLGCVYHIPYKEGIADAYFSTRWFLGRYKAATGKELKGVKELSSLSDTDKTAENLFIEFGDEMGGFLAPWLKKFKAELLIIGGNISFAYSRFGKVFEHRLQKENCNCAVELSDLKEDAALLGSAYLFNDKFWQAVQPALKLM